MPVDGIVSSSGAEELIMSNVNSNCPICGDGALHARASINTVEYKGVSADLENQYSVCDGCGSEQANADQLRHNKRQMMAFKKGVDGLLTGTEVRGIRERLGISQQQAALIFGGGPVAFSKYENDDVAQSDAMDKLLRLAAELPAVLEHLKRRSGLVAEASWTRAEGWEAEETYSASSARPRLRLVSSTENQVPLQAYERRAA